MSISPQKEPWRIDKTINLTAILTTLMMVCGFIVWYSQINQHLQRHDDEIQTLQDQQKDIRSEMNNRFDKVDDKLDKITQHLIK